MANYQSNVSIAVSELLRTLRPIDSLLDVGTGSGWILSQQVRAGLARRVVGLDVARRAESHVTVEVYDGTRLPYPDRSHDVVMAVDVVHHAPHPHHLLREMARVAARAIVLKDHSYSTAAGFATLCVLDEVGNRKFGIPSRYRYQRGASWDDVLRAEGFHPVLRRKPVHCHDGLLSVTNRLQVASVFERTDARPDTRTSAVQ